MTNKHSHFHHQHRNRNRSPYRDDTNHHQQQQHSHQHHHQHRQVPDAAGAPGIVDSSHVTRVVQTISIVQIVDGAGNPLEVQTHFAEPATIVVDGETGVTVSAPGVGAAAAPTPTPEPEAEAATIPSYDPETLPAPAPESSTSDDLVESTPIPVPESSVLPVESLDDISTSALYTPPPAPAAAEPSVYPTISLALNSTNPSCE